MNDVALLDRVETKYFLHRQMLPELLATLCTDYRLLVVAGERASTYRTLYYDTPDLALYHSHHAGALNRYKVRAREYVDSARSFLEVKYKTNKKRTVKYRLPTAALTTTLDERAGAATTTFLQEACPFSPAMMQPVLWNRYRRITLVGKKSAERVTIDIDLSFSWAGKEEPVPELVIVEVKQGGRKEQSPFIQLMRETHIHPNSFSKYCMGVTLLYPAVKANRFKKKQRQIAKVLEGQRVNRTTTVNSRNDGRLTSGRWPRIALSNRAHIGHLPEVSV